MKTIQSLDDLDEFLSRWHGSSNPKEVYLPEHSWDNMSLIKARFPDTMIYGGDETSDYMFYKGVKFRPPKVGDESIDLSLEFEEG